MLLSFVNYILLTPNTCIIFVQGKTYIGKPKLIPNGENEKITVISLKNARHPTSEKANSIFVAVIKNIL